jgi:hypothetical protein
MADCSRSCSLALVSGEGLRRAGEGVCPADCDQGCQPASAAQPRELPATPARSPIGSPRHRRRGRRRPRARGPAPDRSQAHGCGWPGEGSPVRGCTGWPLRGPRRERRLRQPDRRPRVRLRAPPRQANAAALRPRTGHHAHQRPVLVRHVDQVLLELAVLLLVVGICGCFVDLGGTRDLGEAALATVATLRLGHADTLVTPCGFWNEGAYRTSGVHGWYTRVVRPDFASKRPATRPAVAARTSPARAPGHRRGPGARRWHRAGPPRSPTGAPACCWPSTGAGRGRRHHPVRPPRRRHLTPGGAEPTPTRPHHWTGSTRSTARPT